MPGWRQHMKASSRYARGDFAAAVEIYEKILAADPGDGFAAFMLATCYEHQERFPDALRWAEAALGELPGSLTVLQAAARVAVAAGDHRKATDYVLRALALPEVTRELPTETLLPRPLMWLTWMLYHTPFLRRRLRPDALAELQPGYQAAELQGWKDWAQGYLARSRGDEAPPSRTSH